MTDRIEQAAPDVQDVDFYGPNGLLARFTEMAGVINKSAEKCRAIEASTSQAATIAQLQAELAEARREIQSLIESIWRAEYQHEAPQWKPLPDLVGMITQMDNMYAGVRSQRDQARWDLAEAREVPGRIVAWLRGGDHLHDPTECEEIATAIEARYGIKT